MPNERPTTDPARWRVGSTEKEVCATTGKNITPPSHTIRESSMRKRRNDITVDHYERQTENRELKTGS
jgi:hypothetical protein